MSKRLEIDTSKVIELYQERNYTTRQIADLYNCDKNVISRILKRNCIEIKRYKRDYAFFYEQNLSPIQKELIYGSMLGDGGVYKHHDGVNSCRYTETHAISQLEYLKWKKDILCNFVSNDIKILDNTYSKTYGTKPTCVLQSVLHKDFVDIRNFFYPTGIKVIPYFVLTPLSLAAWFFDDGSVSANGRNSYFASLHTEGFDRESIEVARGMLRDCFGLQTYLINVTQSMNVIRFNHVNYMKVCEIIRPYTQPCMAYKNKLFDNPVETCSKKNGASDLKCSDANMSSSLTH